MQNLGLDLGFTTPFLVLDDNTSFEVGFNLAYRDVTYEHSFDYYWFLRESYEEITYFGPTTMWRNLRWESPEEPSRKRMQRFSFQPMIVVTKTLPWNNLSLSLLASTSALKLAMNHGL